MHVALLFAADILPGRPSKRRRLEEREHSETMQCMLLQVGEGRGHITHCHELAVAMLADGVDADSIHNFASCGNVLRTTWKGISTLGPEASLA